MTFDTYFRASSYATMACGSLALAVTGGMSTTFAVVLAGVVVATWMLEGTKWQLSERVGLIIVVAALPLFYVDWNYLKNYGGGAGELNQAGVVALVHLTAFLSVVKLLQVKSDRDWLFIYLISFFQVLLAAGLSVSLLYVAALGLYLFCALLTVICFELRKARRVVPASQTRLLLVHDATAAVAARQRLEKSKDRASSKRAELRRLPLTALGLFVLILVLALPIFFVTPRFGESAAAMTGGGGSGYVGFSDTVTLGDIGRLQKSDRVVMRVRVDEPDAARNRNLRWRGVALDSFDGYRWQRSSPESSVAPGNDRNFFQLGTTQDLLRLTTQTFFVEPIDTPVLFAASRVIALQGALSFVIRDNEGALTTRPHTLERISYRAYSDVIEPAPDILRADAQPYPRSVTPQLRGSIDRYLKFPNTLDTRVASLAWLVIDRAGAHNRYDKARAIEAHLKNDYGYSLEMRAGGSDPLADFLFRVQAGHCEYFATAMTIMLRTQGIAARVVNGFQRGEYNDAANSYTVRQYDAHSWVEVYFPATDSWVSFDPTPLAGRPGSVATSGIHAQLRKYIEALEVFWIQYIVAYDKQEQRSLANALRNRWDSVRQAAAQATSLLIARQSTIWQSLEFANRKDGSGPLTPYAIPALLLLFLAAPTYFAVRRITRSVGGWTRKTPGATTPPRADDAAVKFYERMTKLLDARGIKRAASQTPLEFALAVGSPEALIITRAYHHVRYGKQSLSTAEATRIEGILQSMERVGGPPGEC